MTGLGDVYMMVQPAPGEPGGKSGVSIYTLYFRDSEWTGGGRSEILGS